MRPIFGLSKTTGRYGPKRASALALGACLALSGCYQAPSALDPANWAKKAREGISAMSDLEGKTGSPAASAPTARPEPQTAMAEPEAQKHDARAGPTPDAVASEIPPLPADAEYDIVTREKLAAVPAPADPAPPPRIAAMEPPKTQPAAPQMAPKSVNGLDRTEMKRETPRPSEPPIPAPTLDPPLAQLTAPSKRIRRQSADPPYAVHITSYKKRSNVGKDWKRLVGAHPEQLMGLRVRVTPIDLGPPRGRFYRLKAGPLPSRQFANDLCRSLRRRGLYCAVRRFTGQPPT